MTSSVLHDSDLTYFWCGPLGKLRQLPLLPVGGSTNATEERFGALLTSLTGTGTLDTLGHKRSWQLDWVCLEPAELAVTHAWFLRLTRSPIRLIDPRSGNRLSRDGSSAGSYRRDTTAHTATAGTLVFTSPVIDYPTPYDGLIDGAIVWSVPVSTAATLRIDSATTDRIPLIPSETITLSVLLKGSGNAQLGAQFYDINGAIAGVSQASAVTLTGTWTVYAHTITPSASQVAASLTVDAASGTARDITVGPALWSPNNLSWTAGSGCPRVLPLTRSTAYPGLAREDSGLTLREV